MLTKEEIVSRIQRGVLFLDHIRPNWEKEINLERFSFRYGFSCVIGQLRLWENIGGYYSDKSIQNGFNTSYKEREECTELEKDEMLLLFNNEWIRQIRLKLDPVETVILSLTYKELAGRFPEKVKVMLEELVFNLNQQQAEEWGISSYEFQARVKGE